MDVIKPLLLIAVFNDNLRTNAVYFHKYSSKDDIAVFEDTTIMVLETSIIGCNVACVQTPTCVSFFYKESDKQCTLQSIHAVTERRRYGRPSDVQFWCSDHSPRSFTYRECPSDYEHDGLRSESCYKFIRLPRTTAANASIICEGEGAHLLYIETLEELTHIKDIFNSSSDDAFLNNYWTGATRDGDSWRWGMGGEPIADSLLPAKINTPQKWMKLKGTLGYSLVGSRGTGEIGYACEFDKLI